MNFKYSLAVPLLLGLGCVVCPKVSADAGPLSLGVRAVDYMPTDGDGSWRGGGVQARFRLPLFFSVEGSVDRR